MLRLGQCAILLPWWTSCGVCLRQNGKGCSFPLRLLLGCRLTEKAQADRLEAEATILKREVLKQGEAFVADMTKMYESNIARDEYVDRQLGKAWDRLDRHRSDLELAREEMGQLGRRCKILEGEKAELQARVEEMSSKLCRCSVPSPTWTGQGTSEEPFKLEYAESDDSDRTPPGTTPSGIENSGASLSEVLPPVVPMETNEDAVVVEGGEALQLDLSLTGPGVIGRINESSVGTSTWIEEAMAEVDAVVERAREEFPVWEQAAPPVRQTCHKTIPCKRKAERYPHTMSTAVQPKRKQNFYLLEDDRLVRRRHRRAIRKLGGYESSSESGSEGLDTSDQESHDESSGRIAGTSRGGGQWGQLVLETGVVSPAGTF